MYPTRIAVRHYAQGVPRRRRIYAWEGDYQAVKEPLLVAIDKHEITLVTSEATREEEPEIAPAHEVVPEG